MLMRMLTACFLLVGLAGLSQAAVLYDASVAGQTPADQGMYYLAVDPVFGPVAATASHVGGYTRLNTSGDISESAGFYNYDSVLGQTQKTPVLLDRSGDGYTLRFDARVDAESHASSHRAGLSVLALSSDGWGIELGFWTGSVWAQNDGGSLFTQGESASFDTTAGLVTWDLAVAGSTYRLYADDQFLLGGNLRKYEDDIDPTAEGNLFNPRHVYFLDDFVFLGDNTSSASGTSTLGSIEVLDVAVPEPATLSLLLAGAMGLLRRRRRS